MKTVSPSSDQQLSVKQPLTGQCDMVIASLPCLVDDDHLLSHRKRLDLCQELFFNHRLVQHRKPFEICIYAMNEDRKHSS